MTFQRSRNWQKVKNRFGLLSQLNRQEYICMLQRFKLYAHRRTPSYLWILTRICFLYILFFDVYFPILHYLRESVLLLLVSFCYFYQLYVGIYCSYFLNTYFFLQINQKLLFCRERPTLLYLKGKNKPLLMCYNLTSLSALVVVASIDDTQGFTRL